jgi:L-alanine-DL-glutamate epimerase-like enolase superfamily enzyme
VIPDPRGPVGPTAESGAPDQIVDARARLLRVETGDGVAMSFARLPSRTTILVEIETADGRLGYGESWANFPAWIEHERLATLRQGVFPLIVGRPADDIAGLNRLLFDDLEPIGRQWGATGPIMQAISAVDIALWDLAGKAAGRSVADLTGRLRSGIPVYASSVGPDDVLAQAQRCRAVGYRAVKVRLGFSPERDEAILRAARDGCGLDIDLYADANQAWKLEQALAMAPVLQRYGIAWVEEPVKGNDLADLEALYRRTGVIVATGENLYGRDVFASYCQSPAVHIIQPDVTKMGGLTEAMAICEIAAHAGKQVIPHLYGGAVALAATLQLAGAGPGVTAIEYDVRDNPLRDPVWPGGPIQRGGMIEIPSAPGLGIEPNEAAIRSRHEAQESIT